MPARADAAGRRQVERALQNLEHAMDANRPQDIEAITAVLWRHHALVADAATDRLVSGQARLPEMIMDLIGGFVGPGQERYYRRVAESPAAPGGVRLRARKRLPWPARREDTARAGFLQTLADPARAMAELVVEADRSVPAVEDLREVVGYLMAVAADERSRLLVPLLDAAGHTDAWLWLARAMLHIPDPILQPALLRAAVDNRDGLAVGSIARLASTAADPAARREAEAAVARLRMTGAVPPDGRARWEWEPALPIRELWLTNVDGDGAQAVFVVRGQPDHAPVFCHFVWRDTWGPRDAYGNTLRPTVDTAAAVEAMAAGGVPIVRVRDDAEAVAAACVRAMVAAAAASKRAWSPVMEVWAPLVSPAAAADPSSTAGPWEEHLALDDASYRRRQRLRDLGDELLDHPFFVSWSLDRARVRRTLPHLAGNPLELLSAALRPADVTRLRMRLRRQAWLLEHAGDPRARDIALAAAAGLGEASRADLDQHAILRGMLARTRGSLGD